MNKVFFILLVLMVFTGNYSFAEQVKSDKVISINPQTGKFSKAIFVNRTPSSTPSMSLVTNVVHKKTLVKIHNLDHMILQTSLGNLVLVKKGDEVYMLDHNKKRLRKILCNWDKLLFSASEQKISMLIENNIIDEIDLYVNDSDDLV